MHDYYFEQIKENAHIPARVELVECLPTTFPAHWHEYIEILYLTSGSLTAIIQAEPYVLTPGDMVVINTKELHMTRTEGSTSYLLLQISAEQMHRFFSDFESLHFHTFVSPSKQSSQENHVFSTMLEMLDIFQNTGDGYQLLFTSRLYEFLYYLYKEHAKWDISPDHASNNLDFQRITQIMGWVRKNFRRELTLDAAASSLGISKEYFCRLFKKYTGQTFLEYVTSVRTIHFHEDLLRTQEHITFLMEKNGLTNYKVFMRTFKKLYGASPQQIRKNRITD